MKAIDAHVHVELHKEDQEYIVFSIKKYGVDPSFENLLKEMRENKVEKVVLISENEEENLELLKVGADKAKILFVMYVDPSKTSSAEYLEAVENSLKNGDFKAMKLYPGYEYFNPSEDKCKPLFQLAAKHGVPMIIHTGDTSFEPGMERKPKVRYTRPHYVDDAAVEFPDAKIIIAHAGNPWIHDAAEVAYKNENVFVDISGWVVGKINKREVKLVQNNLSFLTSYINPEKILYGSDWPLVKMRDYIKIILKNLKLSKSDAEKIMFKNALKVFWSK